MQTDRSKTSAGASYYSLQFARMSTGISRLTGQYWNGRSKSLLRSVCSANLTWELLQTWISTDSGWWERFFQTIACHIPSQVFIIKVRKEIVSPFFLYKRLLLSVDRHCCNPMCVLRHWAEDSDSILHWHSSVPHVSKTRSIKQEGIALRFASILCKQESKLSPYCGNSFLTSTG